MTTRLGRFLCALVTIHAFALLDLACASPTGSSDAEVAAEDPQAAADVGTAPPGAAAAATGASAAPANDGPGAPAAPTPAPAPSAGSAPGGGTPATPTACSGHTENEPNDAAPEALAGTVCGVLAAADVDSFSLPVKEDARVAFALKLSGGATVAIAGAGVRLAPSATELGAPITVRAKKNGTLTVTLSKPIASVTYTLTATRL
jgi:hypothetical protein